MENRSVLIAGGAGFLGSHLCKHYLDRGARVVCVDNLSTGRMQNIEHLKDVGAFRFVMHDITDPFEIDENIDLIFNMAAPASPPKYQADPIATFHTIVTGSENLLNLARKTGARILQASTSEVYGDPNVFPQSEDYCGNVRTMGPRACYDEGKRAAETLFYEFHHTYGVDIRVARIFNTYGPNMDPGDGRVVSNFVVQALSGDRLTVYGDGNQTRSFCYVDDMIAGLTSLQHSASGIFAPVNLGNPGEYTILELAKMVLEETQSNSPIEFRKLPKDDPKFRRPDISKAKQHLNWSPLIPLKDGLRQTISHFATELGRNALIVGA